MNRNSVTAESGVGNPVLTASVLLIGEAPGPNTDPDFPLHGEKNSGHKFRRIAGLSAEEYHVSFGRINLLSYYPGLAWKDGTKAKWPLREVRAAADALMPFLRGRKVLLLGRRVATAFRFGSAFPFLEWTVDHESTVQFACLPHPSGQNRWYNKPTNLAEAMAFLRQTYKDIER